MKILFQSTSFSFSDINLQKIIPIARQMGFETHDFGNIPLTQEYTNLDDFVNVDGPFFIYASTKVLKSFSKEPIDNNYQIYFPNLSNQDAKKIFFKIKNNLFYNEDNFDQAFILKNNQIKDHLLNSMGEIYRMNDIIDKVQSDVFIKPSADAKYFNGGILLNGTLREHLKNTMHDSHVFKINPTVLVAPLINIEAEYRFFIIDGRISTSSLYKKNGIIKSSEIVPENIKNYAEEMIKIYQPDKFFVIDIAQLKNGNQKIVEYNCFNCSGLYAGNIEKYLKDIKKFFDDAELKNKKSIKL